MAGNPLLNAYVTEFVIMGAEEDGALSRYQEIIINENTGAPKNATQVVTYYFDKESRKVPIRHIRIYPKKWVGERPCIRFEAFYI